MLSAVAEVRSATGDVAGVGFLVEPGILVTCAHVVKDAQYGPGGTAHVVFSHVPGAPGTEAEVLAEAWRDPEAEDVAFLRLHTPPVGVAPLALGSAVGCRGHRVRSFGFPSGGRAGGQYGYGTAGDLVPDNRREGPALQLTESNDFTSGFSGGPVVDETTSLVIGMISSITRADPHLRLHSITFATPTQVLRKIWPGLSETAVCPYRGLEPFTAEHTGFFYGRNSARDAVLSVLKRQREGLMLLGPSGSGKSSVIQAAVLPALAEGAVQGSDRWLPIFLPRPGADLLGALDEQGLSGAKEHGIKAAARQCLASNDSYERVLLIIDQFEELFTRPAPTLDSPWDLGESDSPVRPAIEQLTQTIRSRAPVTVVLIMRNDFYAQLADYAPTLKQVLPTLLDIPATLTRNDLNAIITGPLEESGAYFENGLPVRIINDILATHDPLPAVDRGTNSNQHDLDTAPATWLPALQLTLLQLWQRGDGSRLTHDIYDRIGTVTGALANWCQNAFDQLPASQHGVAQKILTALVHPPDASLNLPATRRSVPVETLRKLVGASCTPSEFGKTLSALADQRIITTPAGRTNTGSKGLTPQVAADATSPAVELIHDSLIRDWPDLRKWIAQDQEFHTWLDRAEIQLNRWVSHKNPGDLLQGTLLVAGIDWAKQRGLPDHITRFIGISRRRVRLRVQSLIGALIIALIATGLALWQRQTALTSEGRALGAQKQSLSRQLAAQSQLVIDANPDLAALLALHAYRASPTPEAATSLYTASALPLRFRLRANAFTFGFTADGVLATVGKGGTVHLWDPATGRKRSVRTDAIGDLIDMALSPNGRTLSAARSDGSVLIRDWRQGTGVTVHTEGARGLELSPNGRTLATEDGGTVRLWDADDGRQRSTLKGRTDYVSEMAFSPDSRTLATSDDEGVRLWDVTTGRQQIDLPGNGVDAHDLAFSPDGRTLAVGGNLDEVTFWDPSTGSQRTRLHDSVDEAYNLAFSPDGRTLATRGGGLKLWDTATGREIITLSPDLEGLGPVIFSPDGRTLATEGDEGAVLLWDVGLDDQRSLRVGGMDIGSAMAFSPNGRVLAVGESSGIVRMWNPTTGRSRTTSARHPGGVNSVVFSPDGSTLATGDEYGRVALWDPSTGRLRISLPNKLVRYIGRHGVDSMEFSPDGKTLAIASSERDVLLWAIGAPEQSSFFLPSSRLVVAMRFSQDSRTLVTAGPDLAVDVWDLETGRQKTTLEGLTRPEVSSFRPAFSPDGRTLAGGDESGTVYLREVGSGRHRTLVTGVFGLLAGSTTFSPDGRTLATGQLTGGTVRLWDIGSGGQRPPLVGQAGNLVMSVAFSPDGRTVAVAGRSRTLHLHNVQLPTPTEASKRICQAVARDLTPDERRTYIGGASTVACPA
ncbi:nSTAND1 domain-containing NTPase [Streptomyces massasporeus]|uniref:nSTAND1 domain-containing NTPase n=1 Tax=Streptomyces massasporeus TaxID=67324 RepID=UPI003823D11B